MMAIMKTSLEEIKFLVEHQKVPNEEAVVETIGALKDRHGDRYLSI
jgi:hypothetical protein